MRYVNLGKAGVKVSRIALGMGLRGIGDAAEAAKFVEYAIDRGVNFIDCANRYGLLDNRVDARGTSEQALSRVLKTRRDDVVLTTKVRGLMGDGPNDEGLSRYHILREVDRSLARLGTDHVDIYLLHGPDPGMPMDETLRALDDIVTQGKARYVGLLQLPGVGGLQGAVGGRPARHGPLCVRPESLQPAGPLPRDRDVPLPARLGPGADGIQPLVGGPPQRTLQAGREPARRLALEPLLPRGLRRGVPHAGRSRARRAGGDRLGQGSHGRPGGPELGALPWRGNRRAITGSDSVELLDDTLASLDWELDGEERARLDEVSKEF